MTRAERPDAASAAPARLLSRFADLGGRPEDTPEERLQKRLQVVMASASVPASIGWGLSFALVGRSDAALFPLGYSAATALMLAVFALTRRYGFFRWGHPMLVLVAPWCLHLYLGGFAGSGGALLWGVVAAMAGILFVGARGSLVMLAMLVGMVAVGLVREVWFPAAHPLTPVQASGYFVFNSMGLLGFTFFSTRHFMGRVQFEQERAEKLLLNVLPAPIAERLKQGPGTIADRFEAVTVVFSDLVGFTGLSQRLSAPRLVELLDEVFTGFDALADRYGLEKIKTIGDSYMVVAGVPEPCADHAARAARMALAMRDAIAQLAAEKGVELSMRIGIHTGEVVAGVIGRRKFSYDLWGDTVNTASRMESHGEPGKVQVSEVTRAALGDAFRFTDRGVQKVKGKGELHTFWLDGEA